MKFITFPKLWGQTRVWWACFYQTFGHLHFSHLFGWLSVNKKRVTFFSFVLNYNSFVSLFRFLNDLRAKKMIALSIYQPPYCLTNSKMLTQKATWGRFVKWRHFYGFSVNYEPGQYKVITWCKAKKLFLLLTLKY